MNKNPTRTNPLVLNQNGKTIHIWFDDYRHGDSNLFRVAINQGNTSVMICDENIQEKF